METGWSFFVGKVGVDHLPSLLLLLVILFGF